MTATSISQTRAVLELVLTERVAQEARYGEVNESTPAGTGPGTRWLLPYTTDSAEEIQVRLRADYEDFEEEAPVTWVHLIREELAEAFERSPEDPRLIEELVQAAALCVSFAERLIIEQGQAQVDVLRVASERVAE